MWYNHLSKYLLKKGYLNDLICPCVFIKKTAFGFVIIVVYADDINIIGTYKEILDAMAFLREEFEMKYLRKIIFCLSLQIEHLPHGIFVH